MIDVANRLAKLFPEDYQRLVNSVVLVCSKVGSDDELEDIVGTMKDILEKNKNIDPAGLMMMKTILEYNRVCIFPIPKSKKLNDSLQK